MGDWSRNIPVSWSPNLQGSLDSHNTSVVYFHFPQRDYSISQTTLTFRLDSELSSPSKEALGSEASRPQEKAEAVLLTFLGSGSSLI